jgi:hypothetical protein
VPVFFAVLDASVSVMSAIAAVGPSV